VLWLCVAFAACAGPVAETPASSPAGGARAPGRPPPTAELERLAEEALRRGDLDRAQARFRRVVNASPNSAQGHAGLGRVALARGDRAAAREHFDAALAADPEDVAARIGLAGVARMEGDREAALAHLRQALDRDPARPETHAHLSELTGRAPRGSARSLEETLHRVAAHPYDPWALVSAADGLQRAGRPGESRRYLEKAVWLADRDPDSALAATRLLAKLDEAWVDRPLVPVHVYADESVRARVGWRFRLRSLFVGVSNALDNVLAIQFVPVSIGAFRSAGASDDLDAIDAAFGRDVPGNPQPGIQAAFSERPFPRRAGKRKRGLAEFMGRRLSVRLEPGSMDSRVLAHEILHLYGAIHVVEEVDSLMNPVGKSTQLDRASYRIVRATRGRTFRGGGLERDVLPRIDLAETIAAYEAALALNLTFRKLGLEEALESRRISRYHAANQAREALRMDAHLADVLVMVSTLLRADARHVQALSLLEAAARLYGPDTRRGREAAGNAESLRRWLVRVYGVE
jgi:tetratricopeptide (TPR) repeat protein